MFNLLNRFSFFISIIMGFLLTLFLAIMIDAVDFDNDTFLVWLIFTAIFALVFRKIFFSKKFVLESLVGLKNQKDLNYDEDDKRSESALLAGGLALTTVKNEEVVANPVEQVSQEREEGLLKELIHDIKEKRGLNIQGYSVPSVPSAEVESKHDSPSIETADISQKEAVEFREEEGGSALENPERAKEELYLEPGFISRFFAENTLAKIGGVLLFLGVLFLLQLVYTAIGPVGKLIIGFIIGFSVFGVAVYLDKKKFDKESRILLGIAILINYLVILSGRYLIAGEFTSSYFLNEGVTFFFLILNTVFAVVTALFYKSKSLLFFAFAVAYLNPFLVGFRNVEGPYTYLFYGLSVSLGGLVLSYSYRERHKHYATYLAYIAFLGGNIIFLAAPFELGLEWIAKLLFAAVLSLLCMALTFLFHNKKEVGAYLLGTYIFLILLLITGRDEMGGAFQNLNIILSYLAFLSLMIFSALYFFLRTRLLEIVYTLFLPLLIVFALFGLDFIALSGLPFILIPIVILYLAAFSFLRKDLAKFVQYGFIASIGFFIILMSSLVADNSPLAVNDSMFLLQSYSIIFTSLLFLVVAYFFSFSKGLEYLYVLGTISSIVMLLPVLDRSAGLRLFSVVSIFVLMIANVLLPFVNKLLLRANIKNLIFGLVSGVLFLTGEAYYFLYGDMGTSKMTIGLVFLAIAVLYFILSYAIMLKIKLEKKTASAQGLEINNNNLKNIVYSFLGISISVFSLSIAFIFSTNHEIICISWLLEASVLFYFYGKIKARSEQVLIAASLLMTLGAMKLITLVTTVDQRDYTSLIPLTVIFASSLASLYFLRREKLNIRYLHDILHWLVLFCVVLMYLRIIPLPSSGLFVFAFAIFFLIASALYSLFFTNRIRYFFLLTVSLLFVIHVFGVDSFLQYIDRRELGLYRFLHYAATAILILGVYLFNILPKRINYQELYDKRFARLLSIVTSLYFFVITTEYVYLLFAENPFIVTIYWGLFAFAFLYFGISNDVIKYRTLGLYVLVLAVGKILLFDIWSGLDDAILRVVALMVVGALMISISLLYTQKYGGNLKGEFELANLK